MLKTLPSESVDCCVTSPPYYALRDYGVDGQIGLEDTPEAYIERLVDVFREVKRVLRNDGTLWVNIADCYAGSGKGAARYPDNAAKYKQGMNKGMAGAIKTTTIKTSGIKHKDLIGIPWMLAFALRADGWYLRQDIIWAKPNPMPESVKDRCTKSHKDLHFESDKNDYSVGKTVNEIKEYLFGRISQNYNQPMSEKQIKAMKEETARGIYSDMAAEHNLGSICLVHGSDLEITDTDKYEYILTYSFPCQDLSNSGKRAGMEKGSGTRSGMLWEVERILNELHEEGERLPQILLMENVPAVCGSGNIKVFAEWLDALEKLGYGNYYKILNATDYGVPQNRERCFMISLLGGDMYEFPEPIGCGIKLGDVLERNVPEKYYLSDKAVESFIASTEKQQAKGNGFKFEAVGGGGTANSILTRAGSRPCDNFIDDNKLLRRRERSGSDVPLQQSISREFCAERRNESLCRDRVGGVILHQTERFSKGELKETSRTITAKGRAGVIEWLKNV